jgi:hypothetical protein
MVAATIRKIHANLPHEADSGNTDISAQYESLKPNENEK